MNPTEYSPEWKEINRVYQEVVAKANKIYFAALNPVRETHRKAIEVAEGERSAAIERLNGVEKKVEVVVIGESVMIETRPEWNVFAVGTCARWAVSKEYGARPAKNWEIRDSDGRLLDPYALFSTLPNNIVLHVNLLAGVGD